MLPLQKNNQISEKMMKALERLSNLNLSKQTFFTYLTKINSLEKTHAKKVWNSMILFEDKIVKLTFYSSEKVKRILNFTKIYKEFSHHWQKISKVNILNLQQIEKGEIETSQKVVKQKAQVFLQELNKNIAEEKTYNELYVVYKSMCQNLKEDIDKFKSYSDPLCFYNEKFTNEFLEKLKKKYEKCTVKQSGLKTQTQLHDHRRHCLQEYLNDVKQSYVPAVDKILKCLHLGIKHIIDPNKDEAIQKEDFKLKKNDMEEKEFYKGQVENLLGTQSNAIVEEEETDNIKNDFKELFQTNEFTKTEITPDQKFFYDRCENLKNKKVKRSNEILSIQKLLICQLKTQVTSLKQFECQFKRTEKEIFGSDGSETFSKKFRKYFGKNFHQLYELCTLISQKRKSSIEKIYKTIEKLEQKLQNPFKEKKQKLKFFQNRATYVLENLKKLKEKVETTNFSSNQIVKEYKSNVLSTYEDFSKNYKELQNYEDEMDSIFFKGLQEISDLILREAINKSLSKILEKQKNRVQIFRQLKLTTEAQTNFYQDTKYEIFFSSQIEQNLSKNFKSEINLRQYQETKATLSQKQHTLNGMIKHKITCCGVKSQLMTENIKQSFECYLINMKKNKAKIVGCLNILSNGISFSQKSLNPFSKLLRMIVPNRDIDSYKTEVIQETSVLTVNSKKGPIYFYGSEIDHIYAAMAENLGVKPIQKEGSEKNQRSLSGSSFLGNNSNSQSFRIQYQKSTSTSFNKLQTRNLSAQQKSLTKGAKSNTDQYSTQQFLTKIEVKLMSKQYLSQNFAQIEKELPIKDESRFNYNYRSGIHKFLLKEKKRSEINGKVLSFDYSWKVSFPQNVMLKSFKHYQTIYIQLEKNLTKIKIVHGINPKNASLAQKVFYDEIELMNKQLISMIHNLTERECQVVIEPENHDEESEINIDPDDIKVNIQREMTIIPNQKQFLTAENFFKNPKFQRSCSNSNSNFTVISGKS